MKLHQEAKNKYLQYETRRHFLKQCSTGLGGMALASLLNGNAEAKPKLDPLRTSMNPQSPLPPHAFAKAKRVIFLHMSGAPSQLELFDYKPELDKWDGKDCPQEYLEGKRFAFIQGVPKMLGPQAKFKRHGQCGAWVSERLPHFSTMVDEVTFIKSMVTDQFNHAPAQFMMHCGFPRLGRPSMGSWVTYGLGSDNQNLPGFMVLVSGGKVPSAGKSIWGSGFLPSVYQGVQCRTKGDPVMYIGNPKGVSRDMRRTSLDAINKINRMQYEEVGDPEILTRIAQYEMAFRMQISAPEVMDITREPESIQKMYGTEPGKNTFANNALLARRLVENGVRFVQLYHWGWDAHGAGANEALDVGFHDRCREVDQPMTALLKDLKQRGLLEDTLVVWGGEFGRTPMRENRGGRTMKFVGRDHHPSCFTMWMAGGGAKQGYTHGETDDIGYYVTKDKVDVHDLQASILHQMGMDHEKLTYNFQGRDFRLTDVHGHVVKDLFV